MFPDDPEVGWFPYIWLAYLVFVPLGQVFMGEFANTTTWVLSAVAIVAFLPLYRYVYWVKGSRAVLIILAMCGIGVALSPVNVGANTFFIFAAYFAGRESARYIAIVAAILVAASFSVQPLIYFWAPAGLGTIVVGLLGILEVRRTERTTALRLARAEVEALARIAERERIARDLHDLLGHSLSIVALKSELAQRLLTKDLDRARTELEEVRDVARTALSEVRTAVRGYRVGSGAGLRQELETATRALETAGVEPDIRTGPELIAERLDAEHEGVLALALREATTNVIRHADAKRCRIEFIDQGDAHGVEVHDDGRGSKGRFGFGLRGMRERVASLGGRLDVEATAGTLVRVRFFAEAPS